MHKDLESIHQLNLACIVLACISNQFGNTMQCQCVSNDCLPAVLPARPNSLAQQSINTTHYRITWKLSHTTPDEEASYLCINLIQPVSTTLPVPLASSEEFILEVEPGYNYELSLIARNEDGDVKTQPISFHTDFARECIDTTVSSFYV